MVVKKGQLFFFASNEVHRIFPRSHDNQTIHFPLPINVYRFVEKK